MPKYAVLVEFLVEAKTRVEAEERVDEYERGIDYDREGLIRVSILGAIRSAEGGA